MIQMSSEERDRKKLAVAIASVLLEESVGVSISPSAGREAGSHWSSAHRRMSIGEGSLLKSRSSRSVNR